MRGTPHTFEFLRIFDDVIKRYLKYLLFYKRIQNCSLLEIEVNLNKLDDHGTKRVYCVEMLINQLLEECLMFCIVVKLVNVLVITAVCKLQKDMLWSWASRILHMEVFGRNHRRTFSLLCILQLFCTGVIWHDRFFVNFFIFDLLSALRDASYKDFF